MSLLSVSRSASSSSVTPGPAESPTTRDSEHISCDTLPDEVEQVLEHVPFQDVLSPLFSSMSNGGSNRSCGCTCKEFHELLQNTIPQLQHHSNAISLLFDALDVTPSGTDPLPRDFSTVKTA